MRYVYAFTFYQVVSLCAVLYIVFGLGNHPAWLAIHPIATIWYALISNAVANTMG